MPTPPTYLDKINYIIDFWLDPCNAPILVYIKLAKVPAGDAILMWLTFGLADVVRGFWRPSRALGGRPSTRRGKPKPRPRKIPTRLSQTITAVKSLPGIGDDSGGWLGKNIPGAQEVKGRHIGQGQIHFWILDDMGQKVLLALLIADIGIDFLYDWATLLDASEFCQRDSIGSLYARGPGTAAGGVVICAPGNADEIVFKEGPLDWEISAGFTGPRGWTLISAMTVTNTGFFPGLHYQQATITDGGGLRSVFSESQVLAVGQTVGSVLVANLIGPSVFNVRHCMVGSVVTPDGHDVSIFGGGSKA